jgi:hypothetical protein
MQKRNIKLIMDDTCYVLNDHEPPFSLLPEEIKELYRLCVKFKYMLEPCDFFVKIT